MTVEEVAARFARFDVQKVEDYYKGHCPCCNVDLFGNLTIRRGKYGAVLVGCFHHCLVEDILSKVGLTKGDLLTLSRASVMGGQESGKAVLT